jgi:NhaA family Na+:H+ antiporter
MAVSALRDFFRMEAAGGIVLVAAAALAVWVANSPLDVYYQAFLDLRAEVRIGSFGIGKPLLLWINDGLMAIFFLLVGLEIKREVI